jgi:hypothetical protein
MSHNGMVMTARVFREFSISARGAFAAHLFVSFREFP